MSMWKDVDADSLTQGRLFSPETVQDLMQRGWAAFTTPFDMEISERGGYSELSVPDVDTFKLVYPADWAVDAAFADLRLEVLMFIDTKTDDTGANDLATVEFTGNGTTTGPTATGQDDINTAGYTRHIIQGKYTENFLPTGISTMTVTTDGQSNGTVFWKRQFGLGPDCFFRINIV